MRTAEGLVGRASRCLCAGIKSRLKYSGAFSLAYDKILMDTGRRWPHKLKREGCSVLEAGPPVVPASVQALVLTEDDLRRDPWCA